MDSLGLCCGDRSRTKSAESKHNRLNRRRAGDADGVGGLGDCWCYIGLVRVGGDVDAVEILLVAVAVDGGCYC